MTHPALLSAPDEVARRQLALVRLEQLGGRVLHAGSGTVTAAILEQMVEHLSLPREEPEALEAEEHAKWDWADRSPSPASRSPWWRPIGRRPPPR
ncbi:hypothetical protein [Streptacidiphilus sp. EB129]|uniref:hypothetical protein n=1 Tax=Streptacidiphilus sp. EB129 TaxID=3156262 RepID=UPI00351937B3